LLLLVAVSLTLGALELALRVRAGQFFGVPNPTQGTEMVGAVYPGSHDVQLGHVPTPGYRSRYNAWKKWVSITAEGTRSNGKNSEVSGVPIIAVGDSFTFGDEVSDSDTWPAALARELKTPVINGGVFGYGFDQTVLRSEQLMLGSSAKTLIVSVIPDDITRCEYSYRFGAKPYFVLQDGGLRLRNTPVPSPAEAKKTGLVERSLQNSFLADLVLRRLKPAGWMIEGSIRAHNAGAEVSRALLARLATSAETDGHRLLLLVQWHPGAKTDLLQPLLKEAEKRAVEVILVEPTLRAQFAADSNAKWRYFNSHIRGGNKVTGHMTREGNELVAELLRAQIEGP
jgi:hypothetical protein